MPKKIKREKVKARVAIRHFYINGDPLSEKHEKIRKRWSAAFALLCNYHSIQQAIPVMQKEFEISEAQAYRDINEALMLFGNVIKSEKSGHRYVLYEYAVKTFQLAAKNHDYKAMNMAVGNMIKLLGLDRDEPDLPDFEKIKPSLNIVVLDPLVEARVKDMLAAGPVDLEKLNPNQRKQIIDVEHEEVDRSEGKAE